MYCTNCGKLLEDGDKFCTGCGAKIEQEVQPSQPAQCNCEKPKREPVSSAKTGLGAAITAAALACVGLLMASLDKVLAFVGLALAIPSLILGIKSITVFGREKRAGRKKPVATLVLGIVATAFAGVIATIFSYWLGVF